MSAWQEYKKKLGTTTPLTALNPANYHFDDAVAKARYEICESCPRFFKVTKQCKECGCFMAIKTKLKEAVCPLEKW